MQSASPHPRAYGTPSVQMVNELEDPGTVGPDTLKQARAALARAESHEAEEA